MECFASWNHRENVFALCDDSFHKNRSIIIVDKFLHFFSKVFMSCNADAFDVHCFCQFDEIGIHLNSMSVSVFVEDVLPLLHHPAVSKVQNRLIPLELVVEDKEFGADVELRSGG